MAFTAYISLHSYLMQYVMSISVCFMLARSAHMCTRRGMKGMPHSRANAFVGQSLFLLSGGMQQSAAEHDIKLYL